MSRNFGINWLFFGLHQSLSVTEGLKFVIKRRANGGPEWPGPTSHRRGGGGIRPPPTRSRKRSEVETNSKRHGMQPDKLYEFYSGHFGVMSTMASHGSNIQNGSVRGKKCLSTNHFWTNQARSILAALSRSSRRDLSKHMYFDLERSRSRPDLNSRDLKGQVGSKQVKRHIIRSLMSWTQYTWPQYNTQYTLYNTHDHPVRSR